MKFGALRRHPSGALVAVQLLGLLLYALMEDTGAGLRGRRPDRLHARRP
jgi:hypothetical protein